MNSMEDIFGRVAAFIRQEDLLNGIEEVLVGFSGGADSTALVLVLHRLEIPLTAVHLHHGLRGADADADRDWCEAFCRRREIPWRTAALDVPGAKRRGESLEMTGRRLRLAYWRRHWRPGLAVALGHHLDDAVETALFRFSRGANVSGLTGLRPKIEVDGVPIIRPLLCLTRREIMDVLTAAGIADWREDRTNVETTHARNAIRHQVLPVLRRAGGTGYKTLRHLRDDADYLETAAAAVDIRPLSLETARKLHPALFPRVMRRWLRQEAGVDVQFGESAVERLRAALANPGELVDFHKNWFIRVTPSRLLLVSKQPAFLNREIRWHWPCRPLLEIAELNLQIQARRVLDADWSNKDPDREFFVTAAAGEVLVIRPRAPGDRMVPFGSEAEIRLKKLIGAARLDDAARHALFLICNESGRILWVPGVRRAELGRVGPDDCDILELRIVRRRDRGSG